MKPAVRYTVELLLFVFILTLSLLFFRPFVRSLERKLTVMRDRLLTELEQTYSIRIAYESLSPSILRSLSLRNAKIYDAEHNTEIAAFEELSVHYRFFALITGKTSAMLDSVSISNGFIDFDVLENEKLVTKIHSIVEESAAAADSSDNQLLSFFSADFEPLSISIKNVRLRFKDAIHNFNARISQGSLLIDSESLTVSLSSSASYQNAGYPELGQTETAFTIEGKFNKNEPAGSAVANFSHISTAQFGIHQIKLFADYRNDVLTFNTMQDFQPIDFTASWNAKTNDISGSFSCKDFSPLQSVRLYTVPKTFAQFFPLSLTGNAHFMLSGGQLVWDTDMSINMPAVAFSSYRLAPAYLRLAAEGSNNDIRISQLAVKSTDIDLFSQCSFNLGTKMPSGFLKVNTFKLPSGTPVSADIQFLTRGTDILCKIPSLSAGENALLKNIALTLSPSAEKIDYILSAEDRYGRYSFDGSYIYDDDGTTRGGIGFLELHGAFDAVSIGNVYDFVLAAYPAADIPQAALLKDIQCTTEFYISSDMQNFSYNCIRLVLVSNTFNDFYALLSVKGNQSSFALTDIDISYKNMYVRGEINADFDRFNDVIFNSSLVINSVGYQVQGFFSQNTLNIYGDYGLAVTALYDRIAGLTGTVKAGEMPLPFLPLFLTLDSEFQYTTPQEWYYKIHNGRLTYRNPASLTQTAAGLTFSGSADPAGLFLKNVTFGSEDALRGTLAVIAAAGAEGEPGYRAEMYLVTPDNTEKAAFTGSLSLGSNPQINGNLSIENISLARFLYTQGKEHRVSAHASFSGSPDSFSLRFQVPELSAFIQGKDLNVSALLTVEDGNAVLQTEGLEWGTHRITGLTGNFSFSDLTGMLEADYAGAAATKNMKAHISTVFTGVPPRENEQSTLFGRLGTLADQFTVNASLSNWQFGDSSGTEAVPISVIREKEITAVYAGKNDEITGFILHDGIVSLQLAKTLPLGLTLNGSIKKDALNLTITDIRADITRIWNITGMDYVLFYGGELTGNLTISGKPLEPEFNGKLEGRNIKVNSPHYIPEIFGPVALDVIADGTMLEVPYTILPGPSASLWARCTVEFSSWIPEEVAIQCGTLGSKLGVVKTDNLLFKADGLAGCTADIIITPAQIGLYGSATFNAGHFAFKFNELDKFHAKYSGTGGPAFDMKLDLQLGQKAEFRWPTTDIPILRTLVPTETPLSLIVDGSSGTFSMKGNVKMRGGEVFYIKRNFYIREGSIDFVDIGREIEPLISLRAEIRDRDETGEPLRLILTAKDQPLSDFNPILNSEPPRSSAEIIQLLGQVLIGDTGQEGIWQNLLVTSSDLLAQIGFFKKSESAVRDFLKLDAFSFRTLILQNAIFGNLFNINKNTTLALSNYLDNTSVYIGKYFGSAIYADALMHLSHYDSKSLKNSGTKRPVYNNLLFQPEIGLEMATPFFMLRWSVAPTKPDTLFVGDAALTFSWKYAY
ncbi:MAG: translocation/assembly module TamB domain-containing protein [Treponema sp.]